MSRLSRFRAHCAKLSIPVVTALIVLAIWEAAADKRLIAPYILPAPSAIAQEIITSWRILLENAWVTTAEILIGYGFAIVAGGVIAFAMVYIRPIERLVLPWVIATQAVPKIAVGPLFIIWFGFGLLPKIVIAFIIAIFPILINTLVGLRSTDPEMIYLLRSMGAGRLRIFLHLQLPTALPSIFSGLRVAVTLATIGALVGEFVGANQGLGYLVLFANGIVDTKLLFASLAVIVALSLFLYAVVGALDRIFVSWHISRRSASVLQATP